MKLLRKDLLEKLETVAPALASNALLPILTHYWLTGTTLMAFNDQIAIAVPFESDVVGAVPGQVLLSLVKNSKAVNAEVTHSGETFLVNLASTKIKLAHLPADNFAFGMPAKRKPNFIVKDRKAFLDALSVCMLSVGHDTSITDQLGVTLIPADDERHVLAFATDNATIAHARIELTSESPLLKQRTILSEQFVRQVLAHGAGKTMHLEVNKDYALLEVPGVTVFGRLIVSTSPIDFVDLASRHFPKAAHKKVVPIPSKLKLILDRAVIITDSMTDQAATTVTCDGDDIMRFISKTSRGEINETMQTPGHPQVKTRLGPKVLRSGYGVFENMLVTEGCMVMTKGNSFYMVSAFSS